MVSGSANLIEILGQIHHETSAAFLIDAGLEDKVWLPKSIVEDNGDGTFTMPEWLAKEKGLI